MKKLTVLLPLLLVCVLSACSNDETTPQERFDQYIDHWNNDEFSAMYDMHSADSAENYPSEKVTGRYKNIYDDLNISDLEVTYDKPSDDQLDTAMDKGKATFPFHVKMTSIAGPITFDYNATLTQEQDDQAEDDDANWFVNWDPGFIFPEIQNGGKIHLETTEPKRGEILDRNRMPLAINDKVHEAGIVPEDLQKKPEQAADKIAGETDMSAEAIEDKLNQDWVEPNMFVPLKKFPKTQESKVNQLTKLAGVTTREVTGRVYPLGKAASHLTGYISQATADDLEDLDSDKYSTGDMVGKRGLESLFEDQLKGKSGAAITAVDDNGGETVIAKKDVENGKNIETTIDADVQETIYNAYDADDSGTAAAIQPKTGETLALVSSPGFVPDDFLYGISQSNYDSLKNDPQKPLLNRFSSTYAPGSSIKPITAAIGLDNGSIKPGEGMTINGRNWSNGEGWGDYKVHTIGEPDGPIDVSDALIRSNNIYFAKKGVKMGSDALVKGLKQFSFGKELPFDYPIEASSVSSNGNIDDEVQLANTSYGQGEIEVSSLHLALMYTSFLNDGNMLEPSIKKDAKSGQVWQKQVITGDEANLITDALHDVVNSPAGTGKAAQNNNFSIAGKTGTAELKLADDKNGKENGWFVGYPEDDQDILIAMMVEDVQDKGGSGYTTKKVEDILQEVK
ncbi:penicillin-binding protein 3 [Barrientosiimonas marina]|uniref:serine-type D-Ala-D-Ala carboxypeptidase n=1 Tax=Lentibacillus kimchii TaxID=1542911 RepID=A0ABW2UUZ4_9BACI